MMTVIVEEFEKNNCYASLVIENRWNRNVYVASFYEKYGGEYRYPTNQMSYPIEDKKKAYATYRRYKKKCMR